MNHMWQTIMENTLLLRAWNRWIGRNRRRVAGRNNGIRIGKSRLTRVRIQINGHDNTVLIGNGCRLHDLQILVTGNSLRVEIGDNCQLRGKIKVEDAGSRVTVGNGTTMENAYLGAYEGTRIQVGNDCMFSDQVGLRTGDMHAIVDAGTGTQINPATSIVIEPHVWLCRGVTILKGCSVGKGSVVGGFSVVTSAIPPGVLAVGSPAAVVREGIRWSRERAAGGTEQ